MEQHRRCVSEPGQHNRPPGCGSRQREDRVDEAEAEGCLRLGVILSPQWVEGRCNSFYSKNTAYPPTATSPPEAFNQLRSGGQKAGTYMFLLKTGPRSGQCVDGGLLLSSLHLIYETI